MPLGDPGPRPENTQKCGTCQKTKVLNAAEFTQTRSGYSKTCKICSRRLAGVYAKKKVIASDKENQPPQAINVGSDSEEEDMQGCRNLSDLSLDAFLASLANSDNSHILSLEARINITLLEGNTLQEKADGLSKCISEQLKYRFMFVPSLYVTMT
jgi:hypothetical protein